jgi:hypothetical protein
MTVPGLSLPCELHQLGEAIDHHDAAQGHIQQRERKSQTSSLFSTPAAQPRIPNPLTANYWIHLGEKSWVGLLCLKHAMKNKTIPPR